MENQSNTTVTLEQLHEKEVINIIDGKRLGYPCDVQIDLNCGKTVSVILPRGGGFMGILPKSEKLIIPWENIERIGKDIILVRCLPLSESEKHGDNESRRRFFK